MIEKTKLDIILRFSFQKYIDERKIKHILKYQEGDKVKIVAEITTQCHDCLLMEELSYLEYDIQDFFPELEIKMSFISNQILCEEEKVSYEKIC